MMNLMAFKVFLSYSLNPEEQTLVWRLQTLAAAHGVQVYVPQRTGFRFPSSRRRVALPDEVRTLIDQSDCVLGIITSRTGHAVEKELNYALGKSKIIIPIVQAGVDGDSFLKSFPRVFRFSPRDNPGKLEAEVVQFLKQQKLTKENQQALGALVAIGIGLLLLFGLSKQ